MASLIAVSGYAGSGKDEVIRTLTQMGFARMAWATPVSEVVGYIYNLSPSRLEGLEPGDRVWREQALSELGGASPRQALQCIGQAAREVYPKCWVDLWEAEYCREFQQHPVAVSGTRYLNEVEAIRFYQGDVWFIDRPGVTATDHYSESGELHLIREQADVIIHNTGSKLDLEAMVRALALPKLKSNSL